MLHTKEEEKEHSTIQDEASPSFLFLLCCKKKKKEKKKKKVLAKQTTKTDRQRRKSPASPPTPSGKFRTIPKFWWVLPFCFHSNFFFLFTFSGSERCSGWYTFVNSFHPTESSCFQQKNLKTMIDVKNRSSSCNVFNFAVQQNYTQLENLLTWTIFEQWKPCMRQS